MPVVSTKPAAASPIAAALLRWYDKNARALPWRIGPHEKKRGRRPDPYHVWLSEVMLQQTTVATVAPRYHAFLARWPDVAAMAAAPLDDILGQWAGLGYYARARNLYKCAVAVADRHGGAFPSTEEELLELPGVGAYTAAAIAAIAFDRRAVVVDGNIERVAARLFEIETPLPAAKPAIRDAMDAIWPTKRSGDFAQALMDLGATVCRPKNPSCENCPIAEHCAAYGGGRQQEFPRKAAKAQKPQRYGAAFALVNADGEILFERRPEKGLLGGMLGLPGSQWSERTDGDAAPPDFADAPARAQWAPCGHITHVFTHFRLQLDIYAAAAPARFRAPKGAVWLDPAAARLPTVMRKAVDRAIAARD